MEPQRYEGIAVQKGVVQLSAPMVGLKFSAFRISSNEPGVERIELSSPDGNASHISVHLIAVDSPEHGRNLARKAVKQTLDRLAFASAIGIGDLRHSSDAFEPIAPAEKSVLSIAVSTTAYVKTDAFLVKEISGNAIDSLRAQLESTAPGEAYYGMFRSALHVDHPVERFLSVYNLLLLLFRDDQEEIEVFIRRKQPGV
jgi:hypothetical protein